MTKASEEQTAWLMNAHVFGVEVSHVERLRRDPNIMDPHTLETETRLILAACASDKPSPELWSAWATCHQALLTFRRERHESTPVPDHLEPLLAQAGKTLSGSLLSAGQRLQRAVEAAADEDAGEPEARQVAATKAAAERVMEGAPEEEWMAKWAKGAPPLKGAMPSSGRKPGFAHGSNGDEVATALEELRQLLAADVAPEASAA